MVTLLLLCLASACMGKAVVSEEETAPAFPEDEIPPAMAAFNNLMAVLMSHGIPLEQLGIGAPVPLPHTG